MTVKAPEHRPVCVARGGGGRYHGAVLRPTTLIEAPLLSRRLGARVTLASETFQATGSFKLRAAQQVARGVAADHLLTASSGNFGQALAYACARLGKGCTVVMPTTAARVKVAAVRAYGAVVELTDVRVKSRAARLAELAEAHPDAYVASPYDDPLVIEGNASLGRELAALGDRIDTVIAPIGGGGLASGLVVGLRAAGARARVVAAEPLAANDAARSLRAGRIFSWDEEPTTVADGARTRALGAHNWAVLREGLAGVIEVPEPAIAEAVRLLFELANLKAEPTGALAVAALLVEPEAHRGRELVCVISGGNVDPELYRALLAAPVDATG